VPAARPRPPKSLYRLKITLQDLEPPVWREILVRDDATLGQLHGVIQAAMGWTNSHLHAFRVGAETFADLEFELDDMDGDELGVALALALPRPGAKLVYEYDFGDGWEHEVELLEIVPALPTAARAVCTGGARACPIDDVGGTGGWEHLLEVLSDPQHEEHKELKGWFETTRREYAAFDRRFAEPFDPERFDPALANASIAQLTKGKRWEWPAS
jgi:hypothetical protein